MKSSVNQVIHYIGLHKLWGPYLLLVTLCEGEQGRYVEHDLVISVDSVHRLVPCLAVHRVQATTEPDTRRSSK